MRVVVTDGILKPYAAGTRHLSAQGRYTRMYKCRGRHGCRKRPYLQRVSEGHQLLQPG